MHSPELTPASIIDRVLQLVTTDTYGTAPPASDGHVRNLHHHHHEPVRPANYLTSAVDRESLHTPEIEKLRKLVAERRRKMGKQQSADQKHKSLINLLSFFRGPTAKLVKDNPKLPPKPVEDVTISGVTYAPNAPPLVSHNAPMVKSMNRSPKQSSKPFANMNNPSSESSSQFPRIPHSNNDQLHHASQDQSVPFSVQRMQMNGRGFPQQTQKVSLDHFSNTLSKPTGKAIQLPVNKILEGLRNLDRPYTQDVRKINGNKIDPSLLLSQGYWSKPQKVQPKPRSLSVQATVGQNFPGKIYDTLKLPMQSSPSKPNMDWTIARNTPTTKSFNFEAPTDRRSLLPAGSIYDIAHQQQTEQYNQAEQRDQLQQRPFESRQPRDQQRNQLQQNSYYRSLSQQQQPSLGQVQATQPQQLKYQQFPQPPVAFSYPRNDFHQAVAQDQLYVGPKTAVNQLNHQVYQNQAVPPAFGQVGTERPYYGPAANQNNYVVSIRKRRALDDVKESISENEVFPRIRAHGDVDKNDSIQVVKRSNFDDSRKSDDEIDQESVLESLTSDDEDGDDIINDLIGKRTDKVVPGLRISGSAVATSAKDSDMFNVMRHDAKAGTGTEEGRRRKEADNRGKSFRLIEKASYRPNEPDTDRSKVTIINSSGSKTPNSASKAPKSMGPVVVNLPLSNGNEAVKGDVGSFPKPVVVTFPIEQKPGKVKHKPASQQGTSLDLVTSFNRMNTPDPRETSSYTEAHLDNPNINAIASAKIYHGDDTQSNGRTSTNVEITGIEGSQPPNDKEPGEKPDASTSPQTNQSEQNASDLGTEQAKGNERPQESAGVDSKGRQKRPYCCLICKFFSPFKTCFSG